MNRSYSIPIARRLIALLGAILVVATGELAAQQINANFTSAQTPARGCAPFTVNFIDLSPNTVTTWAWDFQNDGTVDATVRNPTFTYTTPGTYTVRLFVTDAPGPNTGTIVITSYVTVFAPPTANAGAAARILCNGGNVQIGGAPTASGGTGPYTYQWTPATGLSSTSVANPIANPTSTTTYTVRVTDANGCIATSSTTVTVVQRPTANAGTGGAMCAGGSIALGGAPTASGGTGPYTYFWSPSTGLSSNTVANPIASPASTTSYTLTVTDANGCTGTSSTTVAVRSNPIVTTGGDRNLCTGSSIVLGGAPTATGATPPYTYNWSPATGLSSANVSNPLASPTSTTTYTLTVTDANGCTGTGTATVNVRPLPVANAGAGGTMCYGGSIGIGGAPTASGGSGSYTYSWTPTTGLSSPTAANPFASPPATTTYTVTVTDVFGCSATSSTTVTVRPRTALNTGSNRSICLGESTVLGGSPTASGGVGGYTYQWSPPSGLSATNVPNPVATPVATTTYTLQVIDASGCAETGTVVVTVRSRPTVNAGAAQTTCSGTGVRIGGSPTASGGSGGYSYAWSPGIGLSSTTVANPIANPPTTTTYTVVVTDNTGCIDSASTTVNVLQSPTANAGPGGTMCRGSSIGIGGSPTASGGTGPYTYVWSPALGLNLTTVSNPVAAPNVTTTYTVTVTDLNGCVSRSSTTVTVLSSPTARAGSNRSICTGSGTVIGGSPTASGGTGPYTYVWTPSNGLSSTSVANPLASPTSTTTYFLQIIDNNGCTDSSSVTVNVNPRPVANAGVGGVICGGSSMQIGGNPTGSGGTGPYTYNWSPAAGLTSATVPNPIASPATTTTYRVVVTDQNGCADSSTVTVLVNPRVGADAGLDRTICRGSNTPIGGSPTATGGTAPFTYLWSPSTGLSATTVANPIADPVVTTLYTVIVTDGNGCSDSSRVTITVADPPVADAGTDRATCSRTGIIIGGAPTATGGTPPYRYSWSPAAGLNATDIANPTAAPIGTTNYTVTITDANGCRDTSSVLVTAYPTPVADPGTDRSICSGSSVLLGSVPTATGGTAPYSYRWSPSTGLSSTIDANPLASPRTTTSYTLIVTDANGCSDTNVVNVVVNPLPTINIGGDRTLCNGSSVTLGASPTVSGGTAPYTYNWTPSLGLSATNVPNPVANPFVTTVYQLEVIDATGCRDTARMTVTVLPTAVADAGPDTTICFGTGVRIGGAPTGSGGSGSFRYRWTPAIGLSSPNVANPIASPRFTTTYTVTVADTSGCFDTSSVTVTVNQMIQIDPGADTTTCRGIPMRIGGTPTVQGGTAPYTYRWFPATGLSSTAIANPVATPDSTTTYRLEVTDALGCRIVSRPVTVVVNQLPTASITAVPSLTFCENDSTMLDAGPGFASYLWSTGATTRRIFINQPGTYSVTVRNISGCTDSESVVAQIIPRPRPTIAADRPVAASGEIEICDNDSVTLDGGANYSAYRWNTGDTTRWITVSATGPFWVTVTGANGCDGTSPVQPVRVFPTPQPQITSNGSLTLCQGDSVTLDAGAGYAAYRWSTGDTSRLLTVRQSGNYTVRVTTVNGCSNSTSATVRVLNAPTADAGRDTTLCFGASTRIGGAPTGSGGSGSFRYRWTPALGLDLPNSANPTATPTITTTYMVTVTDTAGCFDTASVVVTVNQMIQIDPGADTAICRGMPLRIGGTPTVQGGTAPYTYRWMPDTGLNSTAIANPIATPDSTITYRVEVTDALGCRAISRPMTVVVNQLPKATITAVPSLTFCENDSTMLDAGAGYASYRWSTGETTRRIFVTRPGPYSVVVGNVGGCTDSTLVVTETIPRPRPRIVADRPTAASNEIEICDNDSVTLDAGANYTAYVWSTGDTTRRITVRATANYWVTTTAANGCDGTSPGVVVRVFRTPTPEIRPNGPLAFCEGDSVTLDAGAGYSSYRWSNGDTTRQITVQDAGLYTVTVTYGATCAADAVPVRVSVLARPRPRITALSPLEFCEGDSVVLDAGRGYESYLWNTGDTTRWITVGASGRYSVTVSDTNACPATSAPVTIDVHPTVHPTISANGPTEFCQGDSVTLDAGPNFVKYLWNTGAITRWITVKKSGNYAVRVTTPFNCVDSASMLVTVGAKPIATITPSGPLAFCEGDSVTLDAGADYLSYLWSTGDTSRTITTRTAGRYTVVVTTTADCIDTVSADVTVKTLPQPTITAWGPTRFCEGDSVKLEAPRGFASYQWSNGATSRIIYARESGDYWVSVTGSNTCEGRSPVQQIEVVPLPKPIISVKGARPYCEGGSITLDAGVAGGEYYWRRLNAQDPDSVVGRSRTITVTQPGTYTFAVSVTNADTCMATSRPFTVTLNPKPIARVVADRPLPATLCRGEMVHLDGGRGYTEYTWLRSEGVGAQSTIYGNGSNINVAEPGFYSLVVADANGCRDTSETVEVVVNTIKPVAITATGNNPFCENDSVVLDAGSGYRSYRWLPGGEKTQTITVTKAGTYRVVVVDSLSCSDTSSPLALTVSAKLRPRIAPSGTITFCPCDSVLLDAGTDYESIRWVRISGGQTDTIAETGRRIYANIPGEYRIIINGDACRETSPSVFLQADVPTSSVSLPTMTGVDPGTIISVPLTLKNSTNLDRCGWNSYTTRIRFNGNVMQPLDLVPECIETGVGSECVLNVVGDRRNGDSAGVLQKLRFLVMLGDSERTELHFDSFNWNSCANGATISSPSPGPSLAPMAPEVAMLDGQVQVKVCRAGGTRLFHSTGTMELKQNAPNPFGSGTAIEYETTETGRTRLVVTDMAGREVAVLVDGDVLPGRYTVQLDANDLSSGTYYYTLQTPTRRMTRIMQLEK